MIFPVFSRAFQYSHKRLHCRFSIFTRNERVLGPSWCSGETSFVGLLCSFNWKSHIFTFRILDMQLLFTVWWIWDRFATVGIHEQSIEGQIRAPWPGCSQFLHIMAVRFMRKIAGRKCCVTLKALVGGLVCFLIGDRDGRLPGKLHISHGKSDVCLQCRVTAGLLDSGSDSTVEMWGRRNPTIHWCCIFGKAQI